MKTIVVGLGNPYLGDDGVGVAVALELEEILSPRPDGEISITEASVGGVRLMEILIGFDRAILIDAIKVRHPSPGRVHRLTLEDLDTLSPTQHTASAHDTTLSTAIAAGCRMGYPLPKEVTIYAIEVCKVDEFDESLGPQAEAAIPEVVSLVLGDLRDGYGEKR